MTNLTDLTADTVAATTATIGGVNVNAPAVVATTADLVLTAALHAGKVVTVGSATGDTITLPAASGTGNVYTIIIATTATSNAHIVQVANGTDVMDGSLYIQQDTDADGTAVTYRADAGDDTMTFAGAATTGGIVGGYIECVDYAAGFWSCIARSQSGGGAEVTCFSAGV